MNELPTDDDPGTNPPGHARAPGTETVRLGRVVVPLLKGVVHARADPARWSTLIALQSQVRDHVAVMGLTLALDETEGYAFLRSAVAADVDAGVAVDDGAGSGTDRESEAGIPRLVARRPLSFPVSLLLALLRKRLVELDAGGGETRLVMARDEIAALVQLFLPERGDEARQADQFDTHLNKLVELGFLRRLKPSASGDREPPRYEVQRILRAFVDAQWLGELDQRLSAYKASLQVEPVECDRGDDT